MPCIFEKSALLSSRSICYLVLGEAGGVGMMGVGVFCFGFFLWG